MSQGFMSGTVPRNPESPCPITGPLPVVQDAEPGNSNGGNDSQA